MNGLAVAMAADSAVTVQAGAHSSKIYSSAEKLFQLAENAPVGIMMYGNANIVNVPWETMIKLYRQKLYPDNFESLSEYAERFLEFLKTDDFFPEMAQEGYVSATCRKFYSGLYGDVRKQLVEAMRAAPGPLTKKQVKQLSSKIISDQLVRIKKFRLWEGITEQAFKRCLRSRYLKVVETQRDRVFTTVPPFKSTQQKLVDLALEALMRNGATAGSSGVVVAGFGEGEIFPSAVELDIGGYFGGRLLYGHRHKAEIGNHLEAFVSPYAQKEMVATFMNGIDPYIHDAYLLSVGKTLRDLSSPIVSVVEKQDQTLGPILEGALKKILPDVMTELQNEWESSTHELCSDLVMEMVASLPKDELATMAETLVSLTKFKRCVSTQMETVAGPADVAVISKGDGFVWVARKHYFRPELNPRLIARHYRT